MTAFHDGYAPWPAAFTVTAAPERRATIVGLASGKEHRTTPHKHARRRYVVESQTASADELHALLAFFEARRGQIESFRFRDAIDHRSCAPSAAPGPLDQTVGIGDDAQVSFPLLKAYGVGADAYQRRILKPAPSSLRVALNDAEIVSGFAWDAVLAVLVFDSPPPAGVRVSAGFVFDTPVRLDAPAIEARIEGSGRTGAVRVPLIEVLHA